MRQPSCLTPSTSAGTIKATGDQAAVARWLHLIRENKPAIVAVLQETANEASKPQPSPVRRELATLVAAFHRDAGDTEMMIGECVRDALARPELALRCYRELSKWKPPAWTEVGALLLKLGRA